MRFVTYSSFCHFLAAFAQQYRLAPALFRDQSRTHLSRLYKVFTVSVSTSSFHPCEGRDLPHTHRDSGSSPE